MRPSAGGVGQGFGHDAEHLRAALAERAGHRLGGDVNSDVAVDGQHAVRGDEGTQAAGERTVLLVAQTQVVDRDAQLQADGLERRDEPPGGRGVQPGRLPERTWIAASVSSCSAPS